jgi:hypothetical protein
VKLTEKKLTCLVPVSNDLLKNSNIQVDRLIRDDMVRAAANAEDIAFLKGDGTKGSAEGHLLLGRRGRPWQLRRHVAGELAHGHRGGAQPPGQRERPDGQARLVHALALVELRGLAARRRERQLRVSVAAEPPRAASSPARPSTRTTTSRSSSAAAPRRRSTTRK